MNILSLFDGIGCARIALDKADIPVLNYFASEIDKGAIDVAMENYSDIIQLGNISNINGAKFGRTHLPQIDLLIGGSPCQDLSIANQNRKGLDGDRSSLFWEYVRLLNEVNPKYFILENVARMSNESKNTITKALGVEPVLFNAALLSAQDRPRLFWTNIKFELPFNMGFVLKDILIPENVRKRRYLDIKYTIFKSKRGVKWDTSGKGYFSQANRAYSVNGKSPTVPTCRTITKTKILTEDNRIAELHYVEMERLQGIPDNYTINILNKEKRGGVIGNAFNIDVITHILKSIA